MCLVTTSSKSSWDFQYLSPASVNFGLQGKHGIDLLFEALWRIWQFNLQWRIKDIGRDTHALECMSVPPLANSIAGAVRQQSSCRHQGLSALSCFAAVPLVCIYAWSSPQDRPRSSLRGAWCVARYAVDAAKWWIVRFSSINFDTHPGGTLNPNKFLQMGPETLDPFPIG